MRYKKKLTRKELKRPDEFIAITNRIYNYLFEKRKVVLPIFLCIFVAFIAVYLYAKYSSKQEERASLLFSEAKKIYDAEIKEEKDKEGEEKTFKTEEEKYNAAKAKFNLVTEQYKGTKSAQLGYFYLGHIEYFLNNYDTAIKMYEEFLNGTKKDSDFYVIALDAIGQSFESKKDYDKAKEYYQKIIDSDIDYLQDYAYFNLARVHELKKEMEIAKELYEKIKTEFPESRLITLVNKQLLLLN